VLSFAYLFPGQGSQTVGMGQALAETYPIAAATFAEADDVLGFALSNLCFHGPEEALNSTINTQPALLVTSVAAWRAAETELGALPPARFVAGHSLGEYSALVAAGALQFADAVRLVRRRGELMGQADEEQPGGMAAILGLDNETVEQIVADAAAQTGGVVQVANYNSPGQVVVSGDSQALAAAMAMASARGARKVVRLPISIAAHSALMAPAARAMAAALAEVTVRQPQVPVISNITAQPVVHAAEIRHELVDQLTAGVRWDQSVRTMAQAGVTAFVEFGSGTVLTALVKRIAPQPARLNVGDPAGIEQLANFMKEAGAHA
jgi:[acyl-carrier-protein] S-malonyltransferase